MTTKTAPPLTVIGATMMGVPVEKWVQWVTLVYVLVMLGHKLWTWHRQWKAGKVSNDE
ncbi:MAG TPA: hypothetical protein VIT92_16645 [Burkholderiaceae bacterium]